MESNIEFIVVYANITIAYVAFMSIIATLCNSFGERLSDLQYLLVRFFVEVGLLHLMQSLIVIALYYVLDAQMMVWRIATYCSLLTVACYLPYYIMRRRQLAAQIPSGSLFVMIGYAIAIFLLAMTAMETWWSPSLLSVSLYFLWVTLGNFLVFINFLGSFLRLDEAAKVLSDNRTALNDASSSVHPDTAQPFLQSFERALDGAYSGH